MYAPSLGSHRAPDRSQIMNSPMMQNFMNNPELMRSMLMMNPEMRQIMEVGTPSAATVFLFSYLSPRF